MEGAGNDFILINGASAPAVLDPGQLAHRLCSRRASVGADGLILVEPSRRADADIRVRFWNPDGQEAATCGNGTRCAARFAVVEGLAPVEMVIETKGGDIEARLSGETVTLRFRTVPTLALDSTVSGPAGKQSGHRVDIGNRHFVIQMEALPDGAIEGMCRPLRYAPELGPEGANVHLVQVLDRHKIRIRTYERGVEAETLACGSGSISSAVALCAAGHVESPVAVETRSGDVLSVRFRRGADGGFHDLKLEGPARFVYRGEILESQPVAAG
jgi:diaminopimelate epimerase